MVTTRISGPAPLREAYRRLNEQIGETLERSQRHRQDVVVVAVTSDAPPDAIRTLLEIGHVDFGESRPQSVLQRAAAAEEFLGRKRFLGSQHRTDRSPLDEGAVRWHMVGHLARHKVKQVVRTVRLIHTLDSLRLAEELHSLGAKEPGARDGAAVEPVNVLLQVNTSRETNIRGVAPPAAMHLAEQIDTMVHLRLRGLMANAPRHDDPEKSRGCFARLADLFREIREAGIGGEGFNLLSMGDSQDYTVALEEGANVLRIGRALFGES